MPYRRAELPVASSDPEALHHPSNAGRLHELIGHVLEVEAPIHLDELARRVGGAFGAQRVTGRVRRRVGEMLKQVSGYEVVDEFVWARGFDRGAYATVRVGGDRDADLLPAEEIAAAAAWTLSRSFSMPAIDLVKDTARTFGIQRLGAKVESRMRAGVELLVVCGRAEEDGQHIVWKEGR